MDIKQINKSIKEKGYCLLNVTRYANFQATQLATDLGEVMPQYDGEEDFIVQPSQEFENMYYSKSRLALLPHTEAYEFEHPPRLILFHCINPDKNGDGLTPVCDIFPLLNSLSGADIQLLKSTKYNFNPNQGLVAKGSVNSHFTTFLTEEEGLYKFRFSYNNVKIYDHDYFGKMFKNLVMHYFNENRNDILLKKNDILIIDNFRILHSRTSFTDMNRQIRRVWIK